MKYHDISRATIYLAQQSSRAAILSRNSSDTATNQPRLHGNVPPTRSARRGSYCDNCTHVTTRLVSHARI